MRKRLKLMRSLLRLLKPAIGDEAFGQDDGDLRRAHHLLAEAREAGAMIETVHKLAKFAKKHELGANLDPLERAAGKRQAAATEADLMVERIEGAHACASAVLKRLEHWPLPKRDVGLFVEGLRECYARARKKLSRGFAEGSIEVLHEARKSVIHLRYQLDMISPAWPGLLSAWSKELQELRELLGDLSDLDELEAQLEDPVNPLAASVAGDGVGRILSARREYLLARALPLARRLFAERPKAFAERMRAIWESSLESPLRNSHSLKPAASA